MNLTGPLSIPTANDDDKRTKEEKLNKTKEEEKENKFRRRKSATFAWLNPFFRKLGQKQEEIGSNVASEKNKHDEKEDINTENPEHSDKMNKDMKRHASVRMRHSTSFEHFQKRREAKEHSNEKRCTIEEDDDEHKSDSNQEHEKKDSDKSRIMKENRQHINIKIRHSTSFDSRGSQRNRYRRPENIKIPENEDVPQYHTRKLCYTNSPLSKDEVFQRLQSWKKITNRTHSGY